MTDQKKCSNSDCQNPNIDLQGELPLGAFTVDKRNKDGRQSRCKYCYNCQRDPNYPQVYQGKQIAEKAREDGKKLCQNPDCHHPYTDDQGLLPIDQFPDDKTYKSGKGSKCKCCTSSNKEAFYQNLEKHELTAQGLKLCTNHPRCVDPEITEDGHLPLSKFYDQKYRGKVRKMSQCTACIRDENLTQKTKDNRKHAELGKRKCTNPDCQNPNKGCEGLLKFDEFSPDNRKQDGMGARQGKCKYCVNRDPKKMDYLKQYRHSKQGKATIRINSSRRRARKNAAYGSFTAQEWTTLCKTYDYHCLACRKKVGFDKLTVDHIKPLAKGGDNTIDNIQPLCMPCNSSKGTKTIDYR